MHKTNIEFGMIQKICINHKTEILFQLEITKTSDNKATFLHVLAETVYDRFPEVLTVGEELATISDAAKGIPIKASVLLQMPVLTFLS